MKDALEIINRVLSQHATITDHVTDASNKMNDIDAVFNVQRETYKVAWSSSSVTDLLEKRNQLMERIQVLEDGLTKHFSYEEKVFPLVLGEILLKDILSDHKKVSERIEKVKSCLNSLEGLEKDELYTKRTELLESVNELSYTITNHAHSEDRVLNMIKKVFEEHAADKD
ncbi:MAG: hypothetical protein A2158_03575 [Chloroflexi bacterium RBG_13_46_14]|nr:MAG: hypothetical protein A2158_03575 [Chloroflexi bacterium RBG_13_46_14]